MKTSHCVLMIAAAFVIGLQFNTNNDRSAIAQQDLPAMTAGRFQISSYGSPSGHGCYLIDTATGEVWHKQGENVIRRAVEPRR